MKAQISSPSNTREHARSEWPSDSVGTLQARNPFIESAETLQAYIDQGLLTAWYELDNQ